ncbi:MAG: gamma-glutamylcyclotransferase family protein [Saprospiraceae bacterium]|nr:gamma-glutamylcyclotransferase family protein [Saprospiraceae bacterium]
MKASAYIFVYGTLMNDLSSAMARFLRANADFIGEAWIPGILYDLGQYPGLIYNPDADSHVYGHLFQLKNPEKVFEILDHYEGINHAYPLENEYRRALIKLNFQDTILNCWVYLYNLKTEGLKEIPGGNYLEYIKHQPAHLRFIKEGR